MITNVIQLLQSDDWYGVSESVDIAKGKHEYTSDLKKIRKQIKRAWKKPIKSH